MKLSSISIEFVNHEDQRYDTVGDWFYTPDGGLVVRVSRDDPEFPTEDSQVLVAIHELVEVLLCRKRGITQAQVDEFDMGKGSPENIPEGEEPGDQPGAPYRKEHRFAMLIEHLMAHELGVSGYGTVK